MRKNFESTKKITEFIIDIFDNLNWSTFKQFQIREKSTFSILRIFFRFSSEIHISYIFCALEVHIIFVILASRLHQ